MLTLTIIRHAKSSWGDPLLRDIDRPLNLRGKSQAQRMGTYLTKKLIKPDIILCSTAKRARQTLKHLKKNWHTQARILKESQLYLASLSTITMLLEEFGAGHSHIMIIGHNPGLHMLANRLADKGPVDSMRLLTEKYPTSTVCVIRSDADNWKEIENARGELLLFATPKILMKNNSQKAD
jgi:phosphohistidine phosphatase